MVGRLASPWKQIAGHKLETGLSRKALWGIAPAVSLAFIDERVGAVRGPGRAAADPETSMPTASAEIRPKSNFRAHDDAGLAFFAR